MKTLPCLAFLLCSIASAQTLLDAPSTTRSAWALSSIQLGVTTADDIATARNFGPRFTEYNPLVRPFVTRGTNTAIAYFSIQAAIEVGTPFLLDRFHHHRLARAVRYIGIGTHGLGAAVSFSHPRQ